MDPEFKTMFDQMDEHHRKFKRDIRLAVWLIALSATCFFLNVGILIGRYNEWLP